MVLIDKVLDLNLEVVHPNVKITDLIGDAKREALVLRNSKELNRLGAKPLRENRGKTIGRRFYYQGEMYDISKTLKDYLFEQGYRKVPRCPRGVDALSVSELVINPSLTELVSCLERCSNNGIPFKALQIESEAQAKYLFGCMNRDEPIDKIRFDSLVDSGMTVWRLQDLENELNGIKSQKVPSPSPTMKQSSTAPKQSSTAKPVLPKSSSYRDAVVIPAPVQQSTTALPTASTDLIPLIYEACLRIESKLENLNVTPDLPISDLAELLRGMVVSGQREDRFDNRIYLNGDSEQFLLMLFNRVDHYKSQGISGRQTYVMVESECNKEGTEFYRLMKEFCAGSARDKDRVSKYNIEEYVTNRYLLVDGVDSNGNKVRRVCKNPDADKKGKKE